TVADAPLAAVGTTINPVEGAIFTGVVASFTDGNPNPDLSDFSATIDWGDGTSTNGTIVPNGAGGGDGQATKGYARFGTYAVGVTIRDTGGSRASATTTAVVADAPLNASGVSLTLVEGAVFTGTVATFTTPNPAPRLSDFSATVDWGD